MDGRLRAIVIEDVMNWNDVAESMLSPRLGQTDQLLTRTRCCSKSNRRTGSHKITCVVRYEHAESTISTFLPKGIQVEKKPSRWRVSRRSDPTKVVVAILRYHNFPRHNGP